MFEDIVGQDRAKSILTNAIKSDKIAQGYIFYGPEGVGKLKTALTFAKIVNCKENDIDKRPCNACNSCKKIDQFMHPDVRYYFSIPQVGANLFENENDNENEKKSSKGKFNELYKGYIDNKINTPYKDFIFDTTTSIRIEQLREIKKDSLLSRYEGRKKVFIIEGYESVTPHASNAFLKTLEEPPPDTHFILIVRDIDKLLSTILSRNLKIEFNLIPTVKIQDYLLKEVNCEPKKARIYSLISNGSIKKALQLYHEGNLVIFDMTLEFLEMVIKRDDVAFIEWIEKYFVKVMKAEEQDGKDDKDEKDKKVIKKMPKNTELFRGFIQYLCLWIKDIQMYCLLPASERIKSIVFVEHIELLELYTKRNRAFLELLPNLILDLNEYQIKHTGHVNQKLLLSQVYQSFVNTFK